ncbi:MAG TPA: 3-deoxy-D-manno-octulosonic acid transferase [Pyrinomonadaceae bacterium]|nr:3-deoxy-D-manno-octulosonic acid transferase [Pyrinomonadaceae bacterium]
MYLVYSLLLTLGLIVLIPRFLLQAIAHGKYLPGLRQRLGSIPQLSESTQPTVWLHCVSVGETQAARPFVRELRKQLPDCRLVVSTVTVTGQKVANAVFKNEAAEIVYFPIDWAWCVRRSLRAIDPDVVLMLETELWPNFLRHCRKRGVPVAVINGRISKKSYSGYSLIGFFVRRILKDINLAVMQTEADCERIRSLGMSRSHSIVGGNLKFDAGPPAKCDALTEQIRSRFDLRANVPLILAASTHAPEERIIVDSFKMLTARNHAPMRLAIAPRHPERFAEVASVLEKSGLRWVRRSSAPHPNDVDVEAILFDSIGELTSIYPLSTMVFVGGSLVEKGGHNVLEPAAAGVPVITGAHTDNFESIVQMLQEHDAIIKLPPFEQPEVITALRDAFTSLLTSEERRSQLASNALQLLEMNRGVAEKTLELVTPLFQLAEVRTNSNVGLAGEAANS